MAGEESVDDTSLVEECSFQSSWNPTCSKTNQIHPSIPPFFAFDAKVRIFDKEQVVCNIEGWTPNNLSPRNGPPKKPATCRPCVGNNACGSSTEE